MNECKPAELRQCRPRIGADRPFIVSRNDGKFCQFDSCFTWERCVRNATYWLQHWPLNNTTNQYRRWPADAALRRICNESWPELLLRSSVALASNSSLLGTRTELYFEAIVTALNRLVGSYVSGSVTIPKAEHLSTQLVHVTLFVFICFETFVPIRFLEGTCRFGDDFKLGNNQIENLNILKRFLLLFLFGVLFLNSKSIF